MKRELMDILVCPVCKEKLELSVDKENEQEVVSGSLRCPKCHIDYHIVDTIPHLIPPGRCV